MLEFMTTYEPVIDRPPVKWPNGARIAIHTVVNIEYFQPGIPATSVNPGFAGLVPDVYNHSWRDYGVRAGIWRLMKVLDKHQVKATVALNGMVCRHYPRIVEEIVRRGWECMGHGMTNSQMLGKLSIDEERSLIKETLDTIEQSTGHRPKGWLGPALAESWNTPALLEEAGLSYVCDWLNDDEPYAMNTPRRALVSVPYSGEINDIHCFLRAGYQGPDYLQALKDQFDVLYEESAERPAVMAIPLHPFIMGHPYRSKYLDQALQYIAEKPGAWFATGSEIAQAYSAGRK
jgi:peptidoglycan/xylan/chitin deacetylase (PgdA/CDA1 family)